jgi:hypothetical protein
MQMKVEEEIIVVVRKHMEEFTYSHVYRRSKCRSVEK